MPINKWLRIFAVCVLATLVVLTASCSKKKTKPKTAAPMITSTAPMTATVESLYSYSITITGNPAPSLSATGLPAWLSFDGTDTISGTPAVGDVGLSETITITASNGVEPDAIQTFSITVNPAPVAPMITTTAPTTATAESVYSYLIIATGIPTLTLSVTNLPAWLSFDGTDTITGTPTTGDIGLSETITITASNGTTPDAIQTFSIFVYDILYVDLSASGSNNGSSWTDAFTDLQDALSLAASGVGNEIWVAQGRYTPTTPDGDRMVSFQMAEGTGLYGGFIGTETSRGQRDWILNITILSGDLNGDDIGFTNNAENSYTVVTGCDNATLDGFTITGGNANGTTAPMNSGGGMRNFLVSSLTLMSCTFTGNSAGGGGGIYNDNSSLTITNCAFISNSAFNGGGICLDGFFNDNSSLTLLDCEFKGNTASCQGGGLYYHNYLDPLSNITLINCAFIENSADWGGGGMYNHGSYDDTSFPILTNCTFNNNSTTGDGGGFCSEQSSPILTYCIFNGNSAGHGGGMYSSSLSSPTLMNCKFTDNSASSNGGGMEIFVSSPILINTMFSGNSARYYGGGLCVSSNDSPAFMNCTFSGNTAYYGGGIYINSSSAPVMTNCILWGNGAGSATVNELLNDNTPPVISYCNIKDCGGSGSGWVSSFGSDNGGNIDLNPLFIKVPICSRITTSPGTTTTVRVTNAATDFSIGDVIEINRDGIVRTVTNVVSDTVTFTPALDIASNSRYSVHNWGPGATDFSIDLQLQPSSPCIDAGTSTGAPATDILGVERPQGLGVDMGAYEQ
ncbi:MAG: choice-of-anchor Q domain-containing protein [Planctomycetota bacterium]